MWQNLKPEDLVKLLLWTQYLEEEHTVEWESSEEVAWIMQQAPESQKIND